MCRLWKCEVSNAGHTCEQQKKNDCFIYIATSDIFPELHEEEFGKLVIHSIVMMLGIMLIYWMTGVLNVHA